MVLLALSLFNYLVRFVSEDKSVFYGLDTPSAYRTITPFLTPLAVLIVLLWTRRYFEVRAPAGTYRRRFGILAIVAVALAAVYVLGALLAGGGFDRRPTFWGLLADYPERLIPPVYLQWLDPQFLPDSAVTTLLFEWTGVVFWAVLCVLMLGSFLVPAYGTETAATERARELLRRGQGSPLEWMTTWRGNLHWFAADGQSYVAYRVIGGVALTTGDPVGPRDRLRDTVVGFAEFAAGNGWTPCFYSVSSACKAVADELGWSGLQVAEETLLDLPDLAFTGKKFQDIRTALNRAKKSGVEAEWLRFGSAPLAITDQITAISEEWVADKGLPEMGFTLGGLEEVDDPEVRLLVAIDADRTVHGVTSLAAGLRQRPGDGLDAGLHAPSLRRFPPGDGVPHRVGRDVVEGGGRGGAEPVRRAAGEGAARGERSDGGWSRGGGRSVRARTWTACSTSSAAPSSRSTGSVRCWRSRRNSSPATTRCTWSIPDPAALPSIANAIGRAYLPDVSIGESVRLVRSLLDR